jgi:lipopolysaccharide transport system ATP-binding protein
MATAIKVENLSKAYQLGEIGTGTVSRDIERWVAKIRGKEDPFLKIGEVNDRTVVSKSNIVWSLKDINFEITQGDAVGIIGRNGAGKSTLLKLLSRVTSPTTGVIKAKGRIASLLEVGTGFHPELTGKENIYLNGAILGMRKREIDRKFDEIVEFSGVEKYIDTPVKRYSSGMYVRLAFAVAAHLESEILIVDEVLAVGDAEFQKKCMGKMSEVSKGEGRTVLFVSHNMGAVQNLCNKGLFLQNGKLMSYGSISIAIKNYLDVGNGVANSIFTFDEELNNKKGNTYFTRVELRNKKGELCSDYPAGDAVDIHIQFKTNVVLKGTVVGFGIISSTEFPIVTSWSKPEDFGMGVNEIVFSFENIYLTPSTYKISLGISRGNEVLDYNANIVFFSISDIINIPDAKRLLNTNSGILLNQFSYKIFEDVLS